MGFTSKWRITAILITLMLLLMPLLTCGAAEDGAGDGSGGGKSQPLMLLTSVPADGAGNVPVDNQIKLSFNKNVVNMSVKENNLSCFTLKSGQKDVPFKVIMADDQIRPEGKRDIVLVPETPLQPGTSYTIGVSSNLQAKNGSTLARALSISFTTSGGKVTDKQAAQGIGPEPKAETVSAKAAKVEEKSVQSTADESSIQIEEESSPVPPSAAVNHENTDYANSAAPVTEITKINSNWYLFALIIISAAVIAVALYLRKRRN